MAIKGWIDLQHTHVDVAFACWNVLLLIKKMRQRYEYVENESTQNILMKKRRSFVLLF